MIDTLRYWMEVFITLCGFDTSQRLSLAGIGVVLFAGFVLIYAAYRAISCTLWPGEADRRHIKYRFFEDEEGRDAD